MGSGNSGLYHGVTASVQALRIKQKIATLTGIWNGKEWVTKETNPPKEYQGGRSRNEYSDLARDPARGTRVDAKGQKERSIALDLEKQGKLGKVVRDHQASKGADFIDTSSGQKWDVKSPVSHPNGHTSVRKGAFSVGRMMANVQKEISRGNNVILDTRRLTKSDRAAFKKAIIEAGLNDKVIWYDKKGKKGE